VSIKTGAGITTRLSASANRSSLEPVSLRLAGEFLTVPVETINRYVSDVRACSQYLGRPTTSDAVERIAREHLRQLVNSPSPPRSVTALVVNPGAKARQTMGPAGEGVIFQRGASLQLP
jgi:hypothetical protein